MGCSSSKGSPQALQTAGGPRPKPSAVTPTGVPKDTPKEDSAAKGASDQAYTPLLVVQDDAVCVSGPPEAVKGGCQEAPAALAQPEADAAGALLAAPGAREVAVPAPPGATEEKRVGPVRAYFQKFAGAGVAGPPRPPLTQTAFSFLGSFVGIATLGIIHTRLVEIHDPHHFVCLIPPFGAMAVLVYSASKAPLAQPKNAILGNTIGGLVGWLVVTLMGMLGLGNMVWTTAALAVSLTIVVQERTGSVHPPGGATALCFVTVLPLRTLGWLYMICPALLGACVLVAIGMLTNNLSVARAYPQTSWVSHETQGKDASLPVRAYFGKFLGAGVEPPPRPPLTQTAFSFLGSFAGIATLGIIHTQLVEIHDPRHWVLLVAPFGAMAVLVFSACKAPLAQPRNAILGNTIGGMVGWFAVTAMGMLGLGNMVWTTAALAVSLTIVVQELTGTVHPPGGAQALCYVVLAPLRTLGLWYVLCPSLLGSMVLVGVGLFANNLSQARTYPQGWW